MRHEDRELLRVALALSDRKAIDWVRERAQLPDTGELLDELILIENITQSHAGAGPAAGAASQDLPGSWGPLRLIERIGRGAFGEVIRAFDPMLQREVALKLMAHDRSRSAQEQFLAEDRRLARVRHPNVLTVHGADRHEDRVGMWTDLVPGSTLEDLLERQGPFGAGETIAIGMDLCRALGAVHAAGLVHRDVKAANVMREAGGRIVLMDFGSGAEHGEDATGAGMFGTPLAMAPEQLRGEPASPATDLYGMGALVYRLLSRRYPIEAQRLEELRERHGQGAAVPLSDRRPDLPSELLRVVDRALDPDRDQRFPDAGAMEQALAACVPAAHGAGRRRAATPTVRRVVFALVAIAVLAFVAWSRWQNAERGTSGGEASAPALGANPGIAPSTDDAGNPNPVTRTDPGAALSASAQLFRERTGGTESLVWGSRVTPGDGLFLRFQAGEPVHVYVLNEDERGELVVLFPAPGLDLANPLPPRAYRLPGTRAGEPIDWQVTSPGNTEVVIVVASRGPLAELERDLAALPRPQHDAPIVYGRPSEGTVYRLRGIAGTVSRREASGTNVGRLSDLLRGLPAGAASSDVWTWQIKLHNPAP